MLLSTHIVEDVAVLCPRFAVIRNGQVVAETSPTEARRMLAGTIFEGAVAAERARGAAARRDASRRRCWSKDETASASTSRARQAPSGFEPAIPTLEDAYFVLMHGTPNATQRCRSRRTGRCTHSRHRDQATAEVVR